MITFSIVTVVRNDLNGIILTNDSINNQTYKNFEWVVIDGNSTDGTNEYMLNLKFDNLTYVSESDKGIYDAMNKGIKYCKYKYVIFLNAGDTFYNSETLLQVAEKLEQNIVDVLFGGANIYFNKETYYYKKPEELEKVINYSLPGHHQATYYSLDILNKIQYDISFPYSGDYLLIAKMFKYGITYSLLNIPLTKFEVGHHSFKGIYKIFNASTKIQKTTLELNRFQIFQSKTRRITSTLLVIIFYKFPIFLKLSQLKKNLL
jgi:putative colanic acid biosynthesis glycosyltransferase